MSYYSAQEPCETTSSEDGEQEPCETVEWEVSLVSGMAMPTDLSLGNKGPVLYIVFQYNRCNAGTPRQDEARQCSANACNDRYF